ncbi:MAG: glutamine--fructose-6-phosphate transaminase (isomerizing) [Bacilli bacterium]|nr:glutamine--fructose-6-phosphate transaminase (isomerizing) [Bacilli bacterium]
MCGITGYIGKNNNAIKIVMHGLEALEYRGYDSSGIAYTNDNKVNITKEKGKINNLKKSVDFNIKSNLAIGHTRWATHGEPNKVNSHPHSVNKFTIVHNGIIENYIELKEELLNNNYVFKSSTDTEIACAYIDFIYKKEKDILKTLNQVTKIFRGSYALGIICNDDLDNLYAVRKTSPLIIAQGKDENYIASDVPAILKCTNKYILLDDFQIAKINSDNIEIYNQKLELVTKETLEFDGTYESSIKNGFEHFMLKEIHEEPSVFRNTVNTYLNKNFKNIPNFSKYNNLHIVACGSAYHTGLVGKYLIEKYANIPVYVEVASEYRYKHNFYDKQTLVIFVSQSGETADTLACLKKVKEDGIDTLGIVNVVGSSVARESKYVMYTKAGCEIAVATTKAYLAQLTVFSIITMYLINDKSLSNEISSIPTLIDNLINKDYKSIAKEIYKDKNIFFIGRGIDYFLSMEGSLKLKEISYINSVAYQAGELKHGTISLIEKNTPVIAISTDNTLTEKTISNIKEVKARGAKIIFVTNQNIIDNFYDIKIDIPKVSELLQPILTIVPLQLIAYEVAKLNKCDIDKPRNLAKSVTVE